MKAPMSKLLDNKDQSQSLLFSCLFFNVQKLQLKDIKYGTKQTGKLLEILEGINTVNACYTKGMIMSPTMNIR
jgi:hypothetical protein